MPQLVRNWDFYWTSRRSHSQNDFTWQNTRLFVSVVSSWWQTLSNNCTREAITIPGNWRCVFGGGYGEGRGGGGETRQNWGKSNGMREDLSLISITTMKLKTAVLGTPCFCTVVKGIKPTTPSVGKLASSCFRLLYPWLTSMLLRCKAANKNSNFTTQSATLESILTNDTMTTKQSLDYLSHQPKKGQQMHIY